MAGNVNTAPRVFWRNATKFSRLLVKLRTTKQDSPDYGDYAGTQLMVIQLPPGQTANAFEVQDSTGKVLYCIDANGTASSAGITSSKGYCAQVTLTGNNIKTMYTLPVAILPAPGAGLAIVPKQILVQTKPTATQFTGGGVVTFQYHGTAVLPHDAADSIAAAVINSATGSANLMAPISAGIQPPANTGIDITNATGVFATGTGTAIVTIWYDLVTLG